MRKIILIVIISIAFISCNTSKQVANKTFPDTIHSSYVNGTWQLQMLFASENKWEKAPYLNINLKESTFTGFNSISGKFILSESYIAFDKNIISTKMDCSNNYEKAFLSTLLKVNKFNVSKDELELAQGEIVLMKFKRI